MEDIGKAWCVEEIYEPCDLCYGDGKVIAEIGGAEREIKCPDCNDGRKITPVYRIAQHDVAFTIVNHQPSQYYKSSDSKPLTRYEVDIGIDKFQHTESCKIVEICFSKADALRLKNEQERREAQHQRIMKGGGFDE